MPIKVNPKLPAALELARENLLVLDPVSPAKILIVNLMPTKQVTEMQLLRLLGGTALDVDVTFLRMADYETKHTSPLHLMQFYETFEEIKETFFDGMVVTGAPVEHLAFEEVDYWDELTDVLEWSTEHVRTTYHICWGAQAGLYHHHGIGKYDLPQKLFGVFDHKKIAADDALLEGLEDGFLIPHSRHTDISREDIQKSANLEILVESAEAGVTIVSSRDKRQFFITGHAEYDADTLAQEYARDVARGLDIAFPINYYPDDDPNRQPIASWSPVASTLVGNWLKHYVKGEN